MPLEPIYELTRHARRNGFAIGYFESWNLESLQGVIDAAEQTRSPIIIGFNGDFMCRAGREEEERLAWYGALGKAAAESAKVPCGFMFNECPDDSWVLQAVKLGFNLVMPIDSTHCEDYRDYQQRVVEITEFAHTYGVAVEAELDELPDGESVELALNGSSHMTAEAGTSLVKFSPARRTDPQRAASFVDATGIDLFAVSVGNVHVQLRGRSTLDLSCLAAIQKAVSVPLVLHGGTGISDHSLREAVPLVAKVNFGTYLKQRYLTAVRAALKSDQVNPHNLLGIGSQEDVMVKGRQAVCNAVLERIQLLNCCGKA